MVKPHQGGRHTNIHIYYIYGGNDRRSVGEVIWRIHKQKS